MAASDRPDPMLVYHGLIPVRDLTPTERAGEDPRHEGRKGYRAYQDALAEHIREHGFPGKIEVAHEPAYATRAGHCSYIADGHHRWHVARKLGIEMIPAEVRSSIGPPPWMDVERVQTLADYLAEWLPAQRAQWERAQREPEREIEAA